MRLLSTDLASSRVMTPLRPTLAMASEIMLPTSMLPPAETDATLASSSSATSLESPLRTSMSLTTVVSMPRVSCTGLVPAMTIFMPSVIIAAESTVAVVVPSPATSLVADATCFTRLAPRFMNLSENSMFLATVTPSFVILGAPKLCSMTTLRPLGPMVTCTASASWSQPWSIMALDSTPNLTSLARPRVHCLLNTASIWR
mmetsp:Transcript_12188/g.56522  ORF Transcript_12188/g.56522 Transcript_12188/m.56522 type:complete len:201 (+) Transcript_12188:1322-1924(+)